jgi:hypothetical protein
LLGWMMKTTLLMFAPAAVKAVVALLAVVWFATTT